MDRYSFSPEKRAALESLRQPLEDGVVTVSRVAGSVSFPSRFMLVCAMNLATPRLIRQTAAKAA